MRPIFLFFLICTLQIVSAEPERPNFLFIAIDDLNTCAGYLSEQSGSLLQTLYPDKDKRAAIVAKLTPNLDRLAANSRVFARAYPNVPLCGPSRTALLTGIPAHVSGYHGHENNFRDLRIFKDATTLPKVLKDGGYFTAGCGKIFHKPRPEKRGNKTIEWADPVSWSAWVDRYTGIVTPKDMPLGRFSAPRAELGHYGPVDIPTEESADYMNAKFVANLLQKGKASIFDVVTRKPSAVSLPEGQPFFLACGLFRPHLPWTAPRDYFERFPIDEMAINADTLAAWKADCDDLPISGKRMTGMGGKKDEVTETAARAVAAGHTEIEGIKDLIQAYLACVAYVDVCLGQLLDAYEKCPARDNTVLVLWSDHGYSLGEKFRSGKIALWEEPAHCLLLIRDPAMDQTSAGQQVTQPVSLQDIFPTIIARAELTLPKQVISGHDLAPLVNVPAAAWTHPVLTTWRPGNHALRTATHTYIRYQNGDKELYDDSNDPDQITNLASDKAHAATLSELDTELDSILTETKE